MEHEEKPIITSSSNAGEELIIESIHGSNELNSLGISFNENNDCQVMDLQVPGERNENAKEEISEESTRLLIRAVKNYRSLYDPAHPDYMNIAMKHGIWSKVSEKCKIKSVRTCQKKWKSIRDYYSKALRGKKALSIEALQRKKQPWAYWDEMKFMENILKQGPRKRFIPDHSSSDSEERILLGTSYPDDQFEKHLKSVENTNKMIMDYLQKKMKDTEKEEKRDSLAAFFQSMEDLVRTFSNTRQLEVKCKLSAIILGAEAAEMKERLGIPDDNVVPMNFSAPGPSSNMYLNNTNNCNVSYQNPNVYPYSSQPYPPPQNYTSQQLAAFKTQTMQFHQRMTRPNKNK